ncbi:MAG: CHAP domain-containing protein [Bacteroidota bacterium]|nr:CHAP domain-containing protein [Bacteroidota bacterium]
MDYPNHVIKQGETNKSIVKAIQEELNKKGCGPVDVDGGYGAQTIKAVKLFQSTRTDLNGNPLEIDGKIGSITWAALFGQSTVTVISNTDNVLLKEVVKVAASQKNVMEKPLGSNSGPEVNKYLASVGLPPGLFWCMAFVHWCFENAAISLARNNPAVKTGGCIDHWNRTKGKRILSADAVNKTTLVKPGQIFIISHGGGAGHTGIVEKVEGGFIHTIEGNSNPSGSRNGIGVFSLQRKIGKINRGFIEYK